MSRTSRVRALALLALTAAAGCQDYNFNPVGHCVIAPGTKRVTLSTLTSADVLFVVDDSGSMEAEQARLASAFDAFINNLNDYNVNRVGKGLAPIDFHIAVTSTSVFYNPPLDGVVCRSDCPNATSDGPVCCNMSATGPSSPYKWVRRCEEDVDCKGAGTCRTDCRTLVGEKVCCDATTKVPPLTAEVSCSAVGEGCGQMLTHYRFPSGCVAGAAAGQDQKPYPAGSFVALNNNPRVLHFEKSLYTGGTTNSQGFTRDQLISFFKSNVQVGTCGSGQEQGLQAARLAIQKALAGEQVDPTSTTGFATWPQENSKIVLVFVGDEDDCSSPADPSGGVVLTGNPGSDTCVSDQTSDGKHKEFDVAKLVESFASVPGDHPLGGAFIVSARSSTSGSTCVDQSCIATENCVDPSCTDGPLVCGGQAPGVRFLSAADQLRNRKADVVAGAVCDASFGTILGRIADIVKPPTGLTLPSAPAASEVAVLRIARPDGKTRKTCYGPAPATMTAAQAKAAVDENGNPKPYDWWFTADRVQATDDELKQQPTAPSPYVFINHDSQNCEADNGETYSADYLGRLPAQGCWGATAAEADASCALALGGSSDAWTCYNGVDSQDYCTVPTGGAVVGTCICGKRFTPPPDPPPCRHGEENTPGTGNCPWGCTPGDPSCPTVSKVCPN